MLYRNHPAEAIVAAVELALQNHLSQGVKHLLQQSTVERWASLPEWPVTLVPDLSVYGQLGVVP